MAHWTVELEQAWFIRRVVGTRLDEVWWQPPAGARPLIPAALRHDASAPDYLSSVRLDTSPGQWRFVIHVTGTQGGGIGGGTHDLSAAFEADPHVRIESRGETWNLHDATLDATDETEPYIWEIGSPGRDELEAFVDAVGQGAAAHAASLTLWDGEGVSPFAPALTIAAPTVDDPEPKTGATVVFTAGAVGGTATGAISYQWQSFDGTAWSDIAGETGTTLDRTRATDGTVTVRVVVTRDGRSATSDSVSATWSRINRAGIAFNAGAPAVTAEGGSEEAPILLDIGAPVLVQQGSGGASVLAWLKRSARPQDTSPLDLDPVPLPDSIIDTGFQQTLVRFALTALRRLGLDRDEVEINFITSGSDLIPMWETSNASIRLDATEVGQDGTVAGSASITLPGPDAPGVRVTDPLEPYSWTLDGQAAADADAFMQAVNGFAATSSVTTTMLLRTTLQRDGAAALAAGQPAVTAAGRQPVVHGSATATAGVPAVSATGKTGLVTFEAGVPEIAVAARRITIVRHGAASIDAGTPATAAVGEIFRVKRRGAAAAVAGAPAVTATGTQPVRKVSLTIGAGIPRVAASGRQPVAGAAATFEALAPTVAASGREIRIPKRKGAAALAAGRPVFTAAGLSRLYTIDHARIATSPEDAILTALEITHPDVAEPLRVVDATEDKVIERNSYMAIRLEARLANDEETQAPRAEIAIANVGREATRWVESSDGGAGATVRVMQMLDRPPYEIEWETKLDVERIADDDERLVARIGFNPGQGRPAVARRRDPETKPGIF